MFGKKEVEEKKVQEVKLEGEESDELDEMAQKKKKKLPNWIIFVIIGAIILIAVAAQALAGGSKKKTASTMVKTYTVKTGDVQQMANASGLVDSENKKIVYSPVNAKIRLCNGKVGKLVKAGDKIIEFDTTKLEQDNQSSQMNLQQTQQSNSETYQAAGKAAADMINAANAANQGLCDAANALADQVNAQAAVCNQAWEAYNSAKQNASAQQSQVDAAKKELYGEKGVGGWMETVEKKDANGNSYWEPTGNYAQQYYALTEAIEKAKAALDNEPSDETLKGTYAEALKKKDDTDKKIAELQAMIASSGTAGTAELANAQAQEAIYNNLYSQWQSAYNAAQNGTSVDTSDTAIKASQATAMELSSNAAELQAMTAAELVEAGKKGLSADFDGVISEMQAAVGTDATQGAPMFTLVDTNKMIVQIEVPTNDYAKYKTGQSATIKIGNNTYKGQVSNVNGMATTNSKGNQVIVVTVKLMNPDENIVIGATAKVSMTVAEAKNTIYIPTEALNVSTDGNFVFLLEDGKVKETPVELGITSDSKIEITKGLKKDDVVVSDTSVDIKDGMAATAEGE